MEATQLCNKTVSEAEGNRLVLHCSSSLRISRGNTVRPMRNPALTNESTQLTEQQLCCCYNRGEGVSVVSSRERFLFSQKTASTLFCLSVDFVCFLRRILSPFLQLTLADCQWLSVARPSLLLPHYRHQQLHSQQDHSRDRAVRLLHARTHEHARERTHRVNQT